MKRLAALTIFIGATVLCGQSTYGRLDFSLQNAQGQAISGAQVNVYTQASCGASPGALATLYPTATGGTPLTQPLLTDGFGHQFAYMTAGCVTVVYNSPYTGTLTYPDQQPQIGGGCAGSNTISTGCTAATTASAAAANIVGGQAITPSSVAATGAVTAPSIGNVQYFAPGINGAVCNDSTDDTAAFNALTSSMSTAHGGTLFVIGKCLLNSASITVPANIHITGLSQTENGTWSSLPASPSTLDLRFNAPQAKLNFLSAGSNEIDHVVLMDGGSDCAPFIMDSFATMHIHDMAFSGTGYGTTSCNDAIYFGTQSGSLLFQGYGTVVESVFFDKIRRWELYGYGANGIVTQNNVSSTSGGSSLTDGSAIEINTTLGGGNTNTGNIITGNTFEATNYTHFVNCATCYRGFFAGNSAYDVAGGTWASTYYMNDGGLGYNTIIEGLTPGAGPLTSGSDTDNTVIATGGNGYPTVLPNLVQGTQFQTQNVANNIQWQSIVPATGDSWYWTQTATPGSQNWQLWETPAGGAAVQAMQYHNYGSGIYGLQFPSNTETFVESTNAKLILRAQAGSGELDLNDANTYVSGDVFHTHAITDQGCASAAGSGLLRGCSTDPAVEFRNFGNSADVSGLSIDSSDVVHVGGANGATATQFSTPNSYAASGIGTGSISVGGFSNLSTYSQFDPSSLGTTWNPINCSPTITANAAPDPWGGTTAETFTTPGTITTYCGQTEAISPALTGGQTYSYSIWLRGHAGGEIVSIGNFFNIGYNQQLPPLTTTLTRYCGTLTMPSTPNSTFFWASLRASAVIDAVGAQLEVGNTCGTYNQTESTPNAFQYGILQNRVSFATGNLADWTNSGVANGNVPVWNSSTSKWTPGSGGTNISGGVLGSVPYQTAPGVTGLTAANTSASTLCYTETGTGSVGAAPAWGSCAGSAATAFSALTSSTNNSATMQVGSGAILEPTASTPGQVSANYEYGCSTAGLATTTSGGALGCSSTVTGINIDGVNPSTMAFVDPTSSIQTQLNGKQNALTNPVTGPGSGATVGHLAVMGNTSGTSITDGGSVPSVGTWGALNYPTWASGTPFVKMTATGTFALDTNTYLTSSGISGMTAGQVPVAATASTVTSSKALAGSGSAIPTGPTASTSGDAVVYTGTSGQQADAGFAPAPAIGCTTVSSLSPANNGCYQLSTSSSVAMPAASAFTIFTVQTESAATATFTGTTLSSDAGCSGFLSGSTLALTGNHAISVKSDGTNVWASCI